MTAWAATYAEREGWRVFPCVWGTKIPLKGSHGHLDATNDLGEIAERCRAYHNLAVACGPSEIVVVDVDVRNHGDETLAQLETEHGALPITPRVISGSGDGSQHIYLRAKRGARYPTKLGEGIDVKHAGGYVLLPPSMHRSGRRYRWDLGASLSDTPLALAPAWMALGGPGGTPRPSVVTTGAAVETFLGAAFGAAGWLGVALPGDKVAVRCPWASEHSDGRGAGADSSSVLLAPTPRDEHRVGRLHCSHAHCAKRRASDVLDVLPRHAIAAAAAAYPRALGVLAWRSARARLREVGR